MADFSGRNAGGRNPPAETAGSGSPPLAERCPLEVDAFTLERAIEGLQPAVPFGGSSSAEPPLVFRALEDFHPDRLCARVPLLQRLLALRARLRDPASFREATRELEEITGPLAAPPEKSVGPRPSGGPSPEGNEDPSPFEHLLGKGGIAREEPERPAAGGIGEAFFEDVMRAHIRPSRDPEQAPALARLEAALSDALRDLLHGPAFQSLEATWRGTAWLLEQIESGPDLEAYLLDATMCELASDLRAAGPHPQGSDLSRLLSRVGTIGSDQPSSWLLVVPSSFGAAEADIELLAALAAVAHGTGGTLLGGAADDLLGRLELPGAVEPGTEALPNPELVRRWSQFRRSPLASSVALAWPRLLLRLPYGMESSPIETFDFEELSPASRPSGYLWGNPAHALALLIARAFREGGWSAIPPAGPCVISGLPMHVRRAGGRSLRIGPVETIITDSAAHVALQGGVLPFRYESEGHHLLLQQFESTSNPRSPLRGPWS